jgi:hypothetical protein
VEQSNGHFLPEMRVSAQQLGGCRQKVRLPEMTHDDFCRVTAVIGWRITPLWRKGGTENAAKTCAGKVFKKIASVCKDSVKRGD